VTTFAAAKESIYQQFVTDWGSASAYTFDNEKFDPPSDAPWVRVAVRHAASRQVCLGGVGNRKFDRDGLVLIQVFGRLDRGTKEVDDLVEKALAIYEGKTIDLIRFISTVPREIGPIDGWYMATLDAQFTWTEKK